MTPRIERVFDTFIAFRRAVSSTFPAFVSGMTVAKTNRRDACSPHTLVATQVEIVPKFICRFRAYVRPETAADLLSQVLRPCRVPRVRHPFLRIWLPLV